MELLASIRNLQPLQDCKCYCARYQFLSRMLPITRTQLVNQKDLTVNELAALADTIMLSQASLPNVLTEIQADQHNEQVFNLRRPPPETSSGDLLRRPPPPPPRSLRPISSLQRGRRRRRSAGSMVSLARTPPPAGLPASWQETGSGGAPGSRSLPPYQQRQLAPVLHLRLRLQLPSSRPWPRSTLRTRYNLRIELLLSFFGSPTS